MNKVLTCSYPCKIDFLGCLSWTPIHFVLSKIPPDTWESNMCGVSTQKEKQGLLILCHSERCLIFCSPLSIYLGFSYLQCWACSWGTLHPATIKSYTKQYFLASHIEKQWDGRRINRLWNLKSSPLLTGLIWPWPSGLLFPSIRCCLSNEDKNVSLTGMLGWSDEPWI